MTTWSERVRVTERTRKLAFSGTTKPNGWAVEVRLSGVGDLETWASPAQVAVFGKPKLEEALDAAREPFPTREDAEAAAARLVTALIEDDAEASA